MAEFDNYYQQRFSSTNDCLLKLEIQLQALFNHINGHQAELKRIFWGTSNKNSIFKPLQKNKEITPSEEIKKADICELAYETVKHLRLANIHLALARCILQEYSEDRNNFLIKAFMFSNGSHVTQQDVYEVFGGICYMLQQSDRAHMEKINTLIEKTAFHLSSTQALLNPPDIEIQPKQIEISIN